MSRKLFIISLTVLYLLLEIPLNFKILNTIGVYSSASEIFDIEVVGRSLASFGAIVFFWSFLAKRESLTFRGITYELTLKRYIFAYAVSFCLIFPAVYGGIGFVIDVLARVSAVEQRSLAVNSNLTKQAYSISNQSRDDSSSPKEKTYTALLGYLSFRSTSNTGRTYTKSEVYSITMANFKGMRDPLYRAYERIGASVDEAWGKYTKSTNEYRSVVSSGLRDVKDLYSKIVYKDAKAFYNDDYKSYREILNTKEIQYYGRKAVIAGLARGIRDSTKGAMRLKGANTPKKIQPYLYSNVFRRLQSKLREVNKPNLLADLPAFDSMCTFFTIYGDRGDNKGGNLKLTIDIPKRGPKTNVYHLYHNMARNFSSNRNNGASVSCNISKRVVDRVLYQLVNHKGISEMGVSPFFNSFESLINGANGKPFLSKAARTREAKDIIALLPENWKLGDARTFNKVALAYISKRALKGWSKKTTSLGFSDLPPKMTKKQFLGSDYVQAKIQHMSSDVFYRGMPLYVSKAKFNQTILPKLAKSDALMTWRSLSDSSILSDGREYETFGRNNIKALIVPAFALGMSLLMSILNLINLLVQVLSMIPSVKLRVFFAAFLLLVSSSLTLHAASDSKVGGGKDYPNHYSALRDRSPFEGAIVKCLFITQPVIYPLGRATYPYANELVFDKILEAEQYIRTATAEIVFNSVVAKGEWVYGVGKSLAKYPNDLITLISHGIFEWLNG